MKILRDSNNWSLIRSLASILSKQFINQIKISFLFIEPAPFWSHLMGFNFSLKANSNSISFKECLNTSLG